MRRQIEQLDPAITELLAASEAVDRPISVVKEIVENAIDAGATQIDISILSGGQDGISVRDNGHGMDAEDIQRACLRHHSSKTRTAEDALRPRHVGFRGEALYAISRAADVTLTSRTADSDHANALRIVSGEPDGGVVPARGQTGTHVEVGRLFERIPARRTHLGSPKSDLSRIKTYLQRVALQHPEITFSFAAAGGKTHLGVVSTNDPRRRMTQVLGSDFSDAATPVDIEFEADGELWELSGFIRPLQAGAKGSERCRVISVGQFLVDVPEIDDAIGRVWKTLYSIGNRNFGYVLKLSPVNGTKNVNFNAHPQKRNVVVRDGAGIFRELERALHDDLRSRDGTSQHDVVGGTSSLIGDAVDLDAEAGPLGTPIGQYGTGFILSEAKDGLIIVDQHAAHEKMLMERMLDANGDPDFSPVRLEAPVLVADDIGTQVRLEEIETELHEIGIELSHDGGETYMIAAPVLQGASLSPEDLVAALVDELPSKDVVRRLAYDLANKACKRAIKNGTRLTMDQMGLFLRQMEQMPSSATCNHGRPTIHRIGHDQLIGLFERSA